MPKVGICRLCLTTGITRNIESTDLQEVYEKLTNIPFQSKDCKPKATCNLCFYLLKKCHKLKELALRADRVLTGLILIGTELTPLSLGALDREKYNLTHGLGFSPPEHIYFKTCFDDASNTNTTEIHKSNNNIAHGSLNNCVKEENIEIKDHHIDSPSSNPEDAEALTLADNLLNKVESDSEDDLPLNNIRQSNATAEKKPANKLRRIDKRKEQSDDQKILKGDYAKEIILSKKQQLDALRERSKSLNYLNSPYKCELCYKGFLNVKAYENHKEKHEKKSGEFECDVCHMRYQTDRQLRNHVVTSHKRQYACNECGHRSHTACQAREHEKWHRGHTYDCQLCGRRFLKPTTYFSHIRKRHPTEHVCEICGCSFVGRRGLKMHKIKGHRRTDKVNLEEPELESERYCSECKIQFVTIDAWKRHTIVSLKHAPANESSSQCRICGNQYGPLGARKHLLQHLKILDVQTTPQQPKVGAPVNCDECGSRFTNQAKLKVHIKRIHLGIKYNKNIVCEVCGKKCTTNAALKYHQRTHTGERPYACPLCQKRFPDRNQLRIHSRTHTGERPYCCTDCGMRFTQKPALNRHTRVHTGAKPYSCTYCTKTFSQSNSLKLHIKSVHLKVPNIKKSKIKDEVKDVSVKSDDNTKSDIVK